MAETLEILPESMTGQKPASDKPAADTGEQRTVDAPQTQKDVTPQQIQSALRDLVSQFERESDSIRRHHVRRFLEAEEFWKGNQHLIWSERQFRWQTPFEWSIEQNKDQSLLPKFQYVTNIYQAYGLSIIAAISQRLPKVRFQPKSAKSERDIATARAASDVSDVIERNNNLDYMSVRCAYLMWTQGLLGAYVRFVVDRDFGTSEQPKMEMAPVEIAPERYECPQCGVEHPSQDIEQGGLMGESNCPGCGAQLTEEHFRPQEMGEGPVVTDTVEYPNGQEVISIYGGLNLKMMPSAEALKQTPYLILVEEQHIASLRAAYPTKANEIGHAGAAAGAEDTYEKNARMSLSDSSPNFRNAQPLARQVTYKRAWLREWALWAIDDEKVRQKVLELYPTGVMVALAGDLFLEAHEEAMDDHWEICRPMPGVGMYVEAVGASTIPIQKRYNDAANMAAEFLEFGAAPPVFVDARYVNVDALRNKRAEPASFFPVAVQNAPGGVRLDALIKQAEIKMNEGVYTYGKDLIELVQVVSGAMPSIFGGQLKGNDTASGYAMARAQSLGKLGLFWRAVKQFFARVQLLSVECFRRNRTEDYELVVEGKSGQYASKFIHLEDLKGNITAHPEADEDFPSSWAEIRENLLSLLEKAPDEIKALLMNPANAPTFRKFIANPEIVLPMEDDREKQYQEIDQLLAGQAQEDIDLTTGQPTGKLLPSIEPEPFIDNHAAHIATIQEWCVSDKGLEQKTTNPAAYQNVVAHLMGHLEAQAYEQAYLAKIQAEQQAASGPPMPAGAGAPGEGGDVPRGTDGGGGGTLGDAVEKAIPGATSKIQELANQPA